jgi:hypothetical protein
MRCRTLSRPASRSCLFFTDRAIFPWEYGRRNTPISWQGFDYGNPVVFMVITVATAGAICGTDARVILKAVVGLSVGFLLFTFLNAELFIVEEGLVLLPLGALVGAIIGQVKARADTKAKNASG